MARTAPQDAGKAFTAGVLQHLPDALRAQMESFLATPDATGFLTEVGNGTLRQADYSRNLNEVQTQAAALQKWHGELTEWVNNNQESGAAPGTTVAAPAAAAAAAATPAGLTLDQLNAEIGRREAYYAAFTADAVRLSQRHYQDFGEVLDINQLLSHPRLGELRMDGAYQDVFKEKLATRNAAIEAKKLADLEAEIRRKVVSEMSQQPAGVPYIVGDNSPLNHLTPNGEAVKPFDPNAAVAAYEQLVSAKS